MVSLSDLKSGECGIICGFYKGDKRYRQQLLSMGLTPQTLFTVVRRAPLGDPIEIQLRTYSLTLRQCEAAMIKIERVGL